jgi:hypothetical protein
MKERVAPCAKYSPECCTEPEEDSRPMDYPREEAVDRHTIIVAAAAAVTGPIVGSLGLVRGGGERAVGWARIA